MPRNRLKLIAGVAALLLAGLLARGLVENRGEAAREADAVRPAAAPQRVARAVTLDAAAQRRDGIATLALTNAPHRERLRAYARVVDIGVLGELAGRYADARAQHDIAEARLAASRTAFARAQKLYADRQNISAAQLQEAEAAFRVDQTRLAAAQSQLRRLAAAATQDWGPAIGQALVDGSPLLARLIARQEVLLQVTLRPGETVAQPPAGATVQLDAGGVAALQFVSPATRTDPRLQGPSLFFTAPTASGLLAGMSVVALIPAGLPFRGVVVPPAAIVWEGGRAWAYFRDGPDRFARRAVATARPAPSGGYLVQGVPDGAEIVVGGAQMLLSEEFRAQMNTRDED